MSGHCIESEDFVIVVDKWDASFLRRPGCKPHYFFLTHLHADHIKGLTSTWSRLIYTSPFNAWLLPMRRNVKPMLLKELELNVTHTIRKSNDGIAFQVTLLNANHCPGAVMFLFQGKFGNILYTGDFRYSHKLLDNPVLSPIIRNKELSTLYLDNTYAASTCNFPSREKALEEVLRIVDEHPDSKILIGMRQLGKEEVLRAIALHVNERVCVSSQRLQILSKLEYEDVFTTDISQSRIQAVELHTITQRHSQEASKVVSIKLTSMYECVSADRQRGNIYVVPYSDHSSHSELMEFVSHLRPLKLYPIVQPKVPKMTGDTGVWYRMSTVNCVLPEGIWQLCGPAADGVAAVPSAAEKVSTDLPLIPIKFHPAPKSADVEKTSTYIDEGLNILPFDSLGSQLTNNNKARKHIKASWTRLAPKILSQKGIKFNSESPEKSTEEGQELCPKNQDLGEPSNNAQGLKTKEDIILGIPESKSNCVSDYEGSLLEVPLSDGDDDLDMPSSARELGLRLQLPSHGPTLNGVGAEDRKSECSSELTVGSLKTDIMEDISITGRTTRSSLRGKSSAKPTTESSLNDSKDSHSDNSSTKRTTRSKSSISPSPILGRPRTRLSLESGMSGPPHTEAPKSKLTRNSLKSTQTPNMKGRLKCSPSSPTLRKNGLDRKSTSLESLSSKSISKESPSKKSEKSEDKGGNNKTAKSKEEPAKSNKNTKSTVDLHTKEIKEEPVDQSDVPLKTRSNQAMVTEEGIDTSMINPQFNDCRDNIEISSTSQESASNPVESNVPKKNVINGHMLVTGLHGVHINSPGRKRLPIACDWNAAQEIVRKETEQALKALESLNQMKGFKTRSVANRPGSIAPRRLSADNIPSKAPVKSQSFVFTPPPPTGLRSRTASILSSMADTFSKPSISAAKKQTSISPLISTAKGTKRSIDRKQKQDSIIIRKDKKDKTALKEKQNSSISEGVKKGSNKPVIEEVKIENISEQTSNQLDEGVSNIVELPQSDGASALQNKEQPISEPQVVNAVKLPPSDKATAHQKNKEQSMCEPQEINVAKLLRSVGVTGLQNKEESMCEPQVTNVTKLPQSGGATALQNKEQSVREPQVVNVVKLLRSGGATGLQRKEQSMCEPQVINVATVPLSGEATVLQNKEQPMCEPQVVLVEAKSPCKIEEPTITVSKEPVPEKVIESSMKSLESNISGDDSGKSLDVLNQGLFLTDETLASSSSKPKSVQKPARRSMPKKLSGVNVDLIRLKVGFAMTQKGSKRQSLPPRFTSLRRDLSPFHSKEKVQDWRSKLSFRLRKSPERRYRYKSPNKLRESAKRTLATILRSGRSLNKSQGYQADVEDCTQLSQESGQAASQDGDNSGYYADEESCTPTNNLNEAKTSQSTPASHLDSSAVRQSDSSSPGTLISLVSEDSKVGILNEVRRSSRILKDDSLNASLCDQQQNSPKRLSSKGPSPKSKINERNRELSDKSEKEKGSNLKRIDDELSPIPKPTDSHVSPKGDLSPASRFSNRLSEKTKMIMNKGSCNVRTPKSPDLLSLMADAFKKAIPPPAPVTANILSSMAENFKKFDDGTQISSSLSIQLVPTKSHPSPKDKNQADWGVKITRVQNAPSKSSSQDKVNAALGALPSIQNIPKSLSIEIISDDDTRDPARPKGPSPPTVSICPEVVDLTADSTRELTSQSTIQSLPVPPGPKQLPQGATRWPVRKSERNLVQSPPQAVWKEKRSRTHSSDKVIIDIQTQEDPQQVAHCPVHCTCGASAKHGTCMGTMRNLIEEDADCLYEVPLSPEDLENSGAMIALGRGWIESCFEDPEDREEFFKSYEDLLPTIKSGTKPSKSKAVLNKAGAQGRQVLNQTARQSIQSISNSPRPSAQTMQVVAHSSKQNVLPTSSKKPITSTQQNPPAVPQPTKQIQESNKRSSTDSERSESLLKEIEKKIRAYTDQQTRKESPGRKLPSRRSSAHSTSSAKSKSSKRPLSPAPTVSVAKKSLVSETKKETKKSSVDVRKRKNSSGSPATGSDSHETKKPRNLELERLADSGKTGVNKRYRYSVRKSLHHLLTTQKLRGKRVSGSSRL